jgi:hypothetical protein
MLVVLLSTIHLKTLSFRFCPQKITALPHLSAPFLIRRDATCPIIPRLQQKGPLL